MSGGIVTAAARARAHLMLRKRRIGQAVEAVDAGHIPDDMTFREWCEGLGRQGLMIDRKPFRLDNRPALIPLYDAIPTTREEAAGWTMVHQKATQLGLTVLETLADIYMAKKWAPVNIGLYLPDQATAAFKSTHRFMPIVRSSPLLYREIINRPRGEGRGGTEGNVMTRQFGTSLLMFMWTSGKSSTESRPCDVVSLDEVQNMALADIDKVRARMGDSDVRFTLLLSTANMPEADINEWYLRGTQEVWHTRCPHCDAMADLSEPAGTFPAKSIGFSTGRNFAPIRCDDPARIEIINGDRMRAGMAPFALDGRMILPPEGEGVWMCPVCAEWIADAQAGEYLCQNPVGWTDKVRSWLLPRTISPRITPAEMQRDFRNARTGDQRKSFWNRTLARPYVDLDQLPVTLEHCQASAMEGKRVGLRWETEGQPGATYYMGIDQMGGWNAVIIKKRLSDGRAGVVHVAAVVGEEPFEATADLMDRFHVSMCVVEQLPNANSARRFANRFPGRVFLNTSFVSQDMLDWEDQRDRSDRRTALEAREQYTLGINQYKLMQWALFRVRDRQTLFPDPEELAHVEVPAGLLPRKKKRKEGEEEKIEDNKRINIVRELVFDHFTKTALVVQQDEKTRKPRAFVMKIGLDPHFSFANMLCDAAWAREQGTGSMILPASAPEAQSVAEADLARAIPQARPVMAAMAGFGPAPDMPTCGGCEAFNAARGWCNTRKVMTGPREHKCSLYIGRE